MKTLIICIAVAASIFAYGEDVTPTRALDVVKAFRMNSTEKEAHATAKGIGLVKKSKDKVDELRVVSYGTSFFGSSQVKLVFYNDALRGVYMRVAKGDSNLSKWASALRPSLGSPKIHGAYSDFHAGVNFETCVYAEWSRYLLTISSGFGEQIWLERRP